MRGRTNITGGGMSLNATTKEFTVASGKSVVAGDFVEYYKTVSERTLISSEFNTDHHTQIGNSLCIALSSGKLFLLKQTENGMEIIDAYNDYTVVAYEILADGSIAVCTYGIPYIVKLKVVSDAFQFVCAATGVPEGVISSSYYASLSADGMSLYLFVPEYTSNMSIIVHKFSVPNDADLLYLKTINDNDTIEIWTNIDTITTKITGSMFIDGMLYIISNAKPKSYGATKQYISKFQFDDGVMTFEKNLGAESTDYTLSQSPISFYNKYIVQTDGVYIYSCNTRTGTYAKYKISDFGFLPEDEKYGHICISKMDDGNAGVLYYEEGNNIYVQNGVLFIDQNTGDISIESNVFSPQPIGNWRYTGIICIDNHLNDIAYYQNSKTRAIAYNKSAGLLTENESKSYVEPYKGGAAIGVAKQSGTAGQKVEVYVATPQKV